MSSPTAAHVTTNLFLLDELEDSDRTSDLGDRDLSALRAVSDWIESYVIRPNQDIGRPGTVCPYLPGSLERSVLWLAPEQIDDRNAAEVVELMNGYKRWLLNTRPTEGDDVIYDVIAVVFSFAAGSCPARL